MEDYEKYVENFCKEVLTQYGYKEEDFDFYDLAEHDLYIWNCVDDQVIVIEEFY